MAAGGGGFGYNGTYGITVSGDFEDWPTVSEVFYFVAFGERRVGRERREYLVERRVALLES